MARPKIVRRLEEVTEAVADMNRAMATTPEGESEKKLTISEFKKKFPDALYLEPIQKIPTGAPRNPQYEKVHGSLEYLMEYVVGVFESQMIGGNLKFDLAEIPGVDYCRWEVPVNKPVGVPRYVAKHLQKGLGWKEMVPLGRDNEPTAFYEEEMVKPFQKFVHKKRGTFHPIESY